MILGIVGIGLIIGGGWWADRYLVLAQRNIQEMLNRALSASVEDLRTLEHDLKSARYVRARYARRVQWAVVTMSVGVVVIIAGAVFDLASSR